MSPAQVKLFPGTEAGIYGHKRHLPQARAAVVQFIKQCPGFCLGQKTHASTSEIWFHQPFLQKPVRLVQLGDGGLPRSLAQAQHLADPSTCTGPCRIWRKSHSPLLTKLTHAESGQWQASLTVAPLPKNDPQGMGSAITYCRRYALTAMLGLVTEDDDGEAARIDVENMPKKGTPARGRLNASQTKNRTSHEPSQGSNQKMTLESKYERLENLPELDGVVYEVVAAQDGRECIVASGNTQAKKEILKGVGFHWNAQRRIWWKYADAS